MKKKETQEPQETNLLNDKKKVVIRVERYQDLLEILDDKKKAFRLALMIVVIGLALFLGITFLVLEIKRSFTYSDITTNAFGTTTIANEQKEVSYFLFNTAELWANSGIEVKAGDVISIHSSGTAHTAIHHLYDAAKKNKMVNERFFSSNGENVVPDDPHDRLRGQFRIFPNFPQSALIMQVVKGRRNRQLTPTKETMDNFYYVGAQRDAIQIRQDGMLYFAINDIVLEKRTIAEMMVANLAVLCHMDGRVIPIWNKHFNKAYDSIAVEGKVSYQINLEQLNKLVSNNDSIYVLASKAYDIVYEMDSTLLTNNRNSFDFGVYYNDPNDPKPCEYEHPSEMNYYYEKEYDKAWYDDNVGSFLIMIERANPKQNKHDN